MTLSSLLRVLWRQRVFVVPAAWVALLLCVAVVAIAPPTYRASGSVVLLNPPALPQTQIGGPDIPADWQNPYARLGSLTVVGDLMVRVVVEVPTKLNSEQRRKLEELAALMGEENRPLQQSFFEKAKGFFS